MNKTVKRQDSTAEVAVICSCSNHGSVWTVISTPQGPKPFSAIETRLPCTEPWHLHLRAQLLHWLHHKVPVLAEAKVYYEGLGV